MQVCEALFVHLSIVHYNGLMSCSCHTLLGLHAKTPIDLESTHSCITGCVSNQFLEDYVARVVRTGVNA